MEHTTADGAPTGSARTSRRSLDARDATGEHIELERVADDAIALRRRGDPAGPTLVYTRAEIIAFLRGAKNGDFDDLCT